jgi:hypothetical protein
MREVGTVGLDFIALMSAPPVRISSVAALVFTSLNALRTARKLISGPFTNATWRLLLLSSLLQ